MPMPVFYSYHEPYKDMSNCLGKFVVSCTRLKEGPVLADVAQPLQVDLTQNHSDYCSFRISTSQYALYGFVSLKSCLFLLSLC